MSRTAARVTLVTLALLVVALLAVFVPDALLLVAVIWASGAAGFGLIAGFVWLMQKAEWL